MMTMKDIRHIIKTIFSIYTDTDLNLCLSGIMSDMSENFAQIFPINVSIFVRVKPPESGGILLDLTGCEAGLVVLHPVWREETDCQSLLPLSLARLGGGRVSWGAVQGRERWRERRARRSREG